MSECVGLTEIVTVVERREEQTYEEREAKTAPRNVLTEFFDVYDDWVASGCPTD